MLGYSKFLLPLQRQSPDGEMVDALVSGASVERRVGSSPILGTRSSSELLFLSLVLFYFLLLSVLERFWGWKNSENFLCLQSFHYFCT